MSFTFPDLPPEQLVLYTSMILSSPIAEHIKEELGKAGTQALSTVREALNTKLDSWLKKAITDDAKTTEIHAVIQTDLQQHPEHVQDLHDLLTSLADQQRQLFEQFQAVFESQKQQASPQHDLSSAKIGTYVGTNTGTIHITSHFHESAGSLFMSNNNTGQVVGVNLGNNNYYHPQPPAVRPSSPWRFNLPPRSFCFTAREAQLNQIEANFQQESTTTVCQLIAGLGGVGKTSLAVEFALRKLPDYELIAFLSSETIEILKDSLLSLADYLAFTGENAGEKHAALQRWLISPASGRWLLLVDNVDEFEVLRALQSILPFSVNHGQILITSRYPHKLAFAQIVSLKDFTPKESLRFFCNRLETNRLENTEEKHALALAEKLGYLPLALEQAIALIAHDGLSFLEYIQEYDSNRALLLADGAPYAHLSDPALKQVAVTWNMNFQKVFEKNALLRPFMHLCAFMSPEVIPLKWISEGLSKTDSNFSIFTTESSVKRLVSPLSDYSLIQMAQENHGFQLHRIVQEVIQSQLSHEEREDYTAHCIRALSHTFPEQHHQWNKALYLQGKFLAERPRQCQNEELALLCSQTVLYAHSIVADYNTAEPLAKKALSIYKDVLGEMHPDTAMSYNNLATLYQAQGLYALAEPLYQKALSITQAVLGEKHPHTAISYNNLGLLYDFQGLYAQAEPLYQKALSIREDVLGEKHPHTATSYNNLGLLYTSQGLYVQAEPLYQKALSITQAVLGEKHPHTATSYSNLGLLYYYQGLYAQAEPLYQKALSIREDVLGVMHPNTAMSYNNLAALYASQGLYARAEPLHQKALSIRKDVLGEKHPDTVMSYSNLAGLYQAQGLYAQAEPLAKKVLSITQTLVGEMHPDTATSYNNLAGLYQAQGLYAQAEPLYQKALSIRKDVLGEKHPQTATSYNNLAALYDFQGLYAQVEPLYQKALSIREDVLGVMHPDTATSYNNLGLLYYSQGLYAQAEPLYQKALSITQAVLGEKHPDTAIFYNNLGLLYASQGLYAQAEPLYQKALSIREDVLGVMHPDTATSYNNLAVLYQAQGLYTQAEPLVKKSLSIYKDVLGEMHPNTAMSYYNLAALYQAQGLDSKAEPLYQKALSIRGA